MDLGARETDACSEAAVVGHRPSNGYSEECLDRLEPNGNIPKDGSLHRGQCCRREAGRAFLGWGGIEGNVRRVSRRSSVSLFRSDSGESVRQWARYRCLHGVDMVPGRWE